jgi:hypothetical protein
MVGFWLFDSVESRVTVSFIDGISEASQLLSSLLNGIGGIFWKYPSGERWKQSIGSSLSHMIIIFIQSMDFSEF